MRGRFRSRSVFSCGGSIPYQAVRTIFPLNLAAVTAAATGSVNMNGFTGGGQAGYNWQAGTWIYGVEADFNAFNLKHFSRRRPVLSLQHSPVSRSEPLWTRIGCSQHERDWEVLSRPPFFCMQPVDWL